LVLPGHLDRSVPRSTTAIIETSRIHDTSVTRKGIRTYPVKKKLDELFRYFYGKNAHRQQNLT